MVMLEKWHIPESFTCRIPGFPADDERSPTRGALEGEKEIYVRQYRANMS
jgi:hypothetical protein